MPFCPNCGTRADTSDKFCGVCGRSLQWEPVADATIADYPVEQPAFKTLPYAISMRRVVLMSVLTYGLYWFYITWVHYRDHTRNEAYPVWHALAIMVPVYNLFRTHAHMRSFKELMVSAGLVSTISAGWAVALVLISGLFGGVSFQLSGGFGEAGNMTQNEAIAIAILNVISIAMIAGLLVQVQGNLNRYWSSMANTRLVNARIGVAEVVVGLLGGASWVGTIANVLSSASRAGA